MNVALTFLVACALVGLFLPPSGARSYLLAAVGATVVAAAYLSFSGLMR